jgi:predicted membrane protein
MANNIEYPNKTPKGKVVAGVILLVVGVLLLIRQFDFFFFPNWLFSWPMWLIAWGLYSGAKHNWRNPVWFVLVILGVGFLLDRQTDFDITGVMWPVLIIAFGLWIILRKNRPPHLAGDKDYWDKKYQATNATTGYTAPINNPEGNYVEAEYTSSSTVPPVEPATGVPPITDDDILNATAIFGGVNKSIFSKNFRGGDITNIFGGTELDFTQADINGRVIIDITQVFGGTKIIVPANWQVVSDLAAVFAGVDDKRIKTGLPPNNNKILVLKGVSLFAGVDIRSY